MLKLAGGFVGAAGAEGLGTEVLDAEAGLIDGVVAGEVVADGKDDLARNALPDSAANAELRFVDFPQTGRAARWQGIRCAAISPAGNSRASGTLNRDTFSCGY